MRMTRIGHGIATSCSVSENPSPSGSPMSTKTISGRSSVALANPSATLPARPITA